MKLAICWPLIEHINIYIYIYICSSPKYRSLVCSLNKANKIKTKWRDHVLLNASELEILQMYVHRRSESSRGFFRAFLRLVRILTSSKASLTKVDWPSRTPVSEHWSTITLTPPPRPYPRNHSWPIYFDCQVRQDMRWEREGITVYINVTDLSEIL
jgi:hypothetical protein